MNGETWLPVPNSGMHHIPSWLAQPKSCSREQLDKDQPDERNPVQLLNFLLQSRVL